MAVGDKLLPLHPHWPARQCWAHLTWRTGPNPRATNHLGLENETGHGGGQEGNRPMLFE